MKKKPKFYLTTAISYTNGQPHIGHAYEAVTADAIARFKRLDGYDVFFTTGTDEYGQKVQRAAHALDMEPIDYVDEISKKFRSMAEDMNCSFDRFTRTSSKVHTDSVQEFWRRMRENGDIYLSKYSGWYSVRDEAFYSVEETYLDEKKQRYGAQGTPVEWVEEESYFFRLSAYQEKLLELYEQNPRFILPDSRKNEIIAFVKQGLKDLSISRTAFDWGVPVPDDDRHIMYVWVDALSSYLTGCDFPSEEKDLWSYWPANVHIVGKDITRFHAIYWPAFLLSAGLPVPDCIFGHGFLLNRGEKMSKSLGNVVDPSYLTDTYGVDQIRYFFLREVPFGQDGNCNHEAIVQRLNADLANDFGNLVQRSLSMIAKNLEGALIRPEEEAFTEEDHAILKAADELLPEIRAAMDSFALQECLTKLWGCIALTNRYFASQAPWTFKKTDPTRMNTILYVTAETLRQIAILTQPFLPDASGKVLDLLQIEQEQRDFSFLGSCGRLDTRSLLPVPYPVFPRFIETEEDHVHISR